MRRGRSHRGAGGLLTILFTDLESSTAVTQRLGDAAAQTILRAHNVIVRREIAARNGSDIKHTGDGIMATFPSAARAVGCAVAIQRAAETYSREHPGNAFRVSIGLNAGEPVAEDADVFGAAVQLAARTCSEAKGGQILATNVVRELVLGKGVLFSEAGSADMKGFERPVPLYEVTPGEGGIDEGEAEKTPFLRRPIVWAAGSVIVALAIGGVFAGVFAMNDGAESSSASVEYEEYRIQVNVEFPVEVTAGDCVTTDVVARGSDKDIQIAGDLTGEASLTFESRLAAADGCRSLTSHESAEYRLAGGSLAGNTVSISLARLGNSLVAATTETATAGIVSGTEGNYAGSVGKQTCRGVGLTRAQSGATEAVATYDCTVKLTRSSDELPIMVHAVANSGEIATQLSSSGESDIVRVAAAFRNNTDKPLTGVTLHLPQPERARIASHAPGEESWNEGPAAIELPDLQPGETASYVLDVRLLDTDLDRLTLLPEISAADLDNSDRSDPIELTVVR